MQKVTTASLGGGGDGWGSEKRAGGRLPLRSWQQGWRTTQVGEDLCKRLLVLGCAGVFLRCVCVHGCLWPTQAGWLVGGWGLSAL